MPKIKKTLGSTGTQGSDTVKRVVDARIQVLVVVGDDRHEARIVGHRGRIGQVGVELKLSAIAENVKILQFCQTIFPYLPPRQLIGVVYLI